MKTVIFNKIFLLLFLFIFNVLSAQKPKIFVELGADKTISCGDSITLSSRTSEWLALNFNVQYNSNFNNVFFTSSQTGLVADQNSNFYKTTDGGHTWNTVNNGVFNGISNLSFVNQNVGFFSSGYNIYKTEDGGGTWKSVTTAPSLINALFFKDVNIGFMSAGLHFAKTTDGGSTWMDITTNAPTYFNKIIFIDDRTIIGSSTYGIYKSSDEGINWNKVSYSFSSDISYNDDGVFCYISGGIIYRSTDFGNTWKQIYSGSEQLNSIAFFLKDTCYAVGNNGVLVESYDKGSTWNLSLTAAGNNYKIFVSDSVKVIVGGFNRILKWKRLNSPQYYWTCNGVPVDGHLPNLKVSPRVTSKYKLLVKQDDLEGSDSVLVKNDFVVKLGEDRTLSCGDSIELSVKTSEFKSLTSTVNENLAFNYFVNDSTGFIVGKGIYKTTNKGKTWTNLITESYQLTGIHFTNELTGYVSGFSSTLLKTADGGKTWTRYPNGINEDLYGIYFINSSTGFTYGSNTKIFKTSNGGSTWEIVCSKMQSPLLTMAFSNSTIGFAGGDKGLVLKTSDGGSSWNAIDLGITDDIVSIAFYDENNGLMAGTNGLVLRTADGGKTWVKINSRSTKVFSTVNFISKNQVFAMGDEIIYSDDGGLSWELFRSPQRQYVYSAFNINNTLYTVGQFGEMLFYKAYKNITFKWTTSSGENAVSETFTVKPLTSSVCYLTAMSDQGCIAKDTVTLKLKGLNLHVFANRNRITCSDSTLLTAETWTRYSDMPGSATSGVSFIDLDSIVVGGSYRINVTTNSGKSWTDSYNYLSLISTSFIDTNTGFGVGYDKKVYKTTDGGKTWTYNNQAGYQYVLFMNNVGFIAGDSGKIIRTKDGGRTWDKLNSGIKQSLISLDYLDDDFLVAKSDSGKFIITKNLGTSWYQVNNPVNDKIVSLYMLNVNEGYAFSVGRYIYFTNNGGISWEQKSSSVLRIKSLFFINQKRGYSFDESSNSVYETSDGGLSWERSNAFSEGYRQFVFPRPGLALAISNASEFKVYKAGQFKEFLWQSVDGFQSSNPFFTYVKPKSSTIYNLRVYSDGCYASDSVLVGLDPLHVSLGKDISVLPGDSVKLFASVGNRNGKWNLFFLNFSRISFPSHLVGYGLTSSGSVYKTIDGGKNWSNLISLSNVKEIYFIDQLNGYASGSELYKTSDGGVTWAKVNIDLFNYINRVYFLNRKRGFVFSGGSFYMETNDFGRSWRKIDLGNGYGLKDFFFLNDSTGYILLQNSGGYLFTRNGGSTWEKKSVLIPGSNPQVIAFTDSLHGTIAGNSIIKTNDGGKSWKQVKNPSTNSIINLKFVNKNTGYALAYGTIIRTDDGGETWVLDNRISFNFGSGEIHFPDENHGFICMENGILGVYSETLKAEFKWSPSSVFSKSEGDIQTLKVTQPLQVIVTARNNDGCTASDTVFISVPDVSKLPVLEKIDIKESLVTLDPGQSQYLTVISLPFDAYNNEISFSSTNPSVAIVDASGKVTALKGGQTTIFARSPDGKIWDNCVVNVKFFLEGISLSPQYSGVEVGGRSVLYIDFFPSQVMEDFLVFVSSPEYVQIVEKGVNYIVVTGLVSGYSDITIRSMDNKYASTSTVFVGPRLSKINIAEEEITMEVDRMKKLTFSYTPTTVSRDFFVWLCSDTSIITVDSLGLVKAKRVGEAAVGCFYIFNFNKFDTCVVHVIEPEPPKDNHVYPNPCRSYINVESGKYEDMIDYVTIYNFKGEMILRKRILASKTKINLESLSRGNYFIEYTILNSPDRFKYMFVKL